MTTFWNQILRPAAGLPATACAAAETQLDGDEAIAAETGDYPVDPYVEMFDANARNIRVGEFTLLGQMGVPAPYFAGATAVLSPKMGKASTIAEAMLDPPSIKYDVIVDTMLYLANEAKLTATHSRKALLIAAYWKRMGAESKLMQSIDPLIAASYFMAGTSSAFFDITRGKLRSLSLAEEADITPGFFNSFTYAANKASSRSLHIELGGGPTPYGLRLAEERPEDIVVSIDPMPQELIRPTLGAFNELNKGEGPLQKMYEHYYLVEEGRLPKPKRFARISGYAQWMALALAERPLADSVAMVAPNISDLPAMMLSAFLAVKPGGKVTIISTPQDRIPSELLSMPGLTVEKRVVLRQDDPASPLSPMVESLSHEWPYIATVLGVSEL